MVNKYIYTKDMVEEYQNAWWNNTFKTGNIVITGTLIIGIMVVVKGFIENDVKFALIISFILLPIMYLVMFNYKKRRAIKNELKKYESTYRGKEQKIEIRLKDSIQIISNNKKTEVSYDEIENYIETKNLIILLVKGNMTIAFKKGAFTGGTDEECKKLLDEKLSKFKGKRRKRCIKHGKN